MREIDAATALAWAKAGTARIIDVREPAEFSSAHISGARSIPLGTLDRVEIAPSEGEKLVLVCASGRRSAMACERLTGSGREVYSLAGGIGAWRQAGGAITEGASKVLPLERQVLAIAGFLVLSGVVLSLTVHPWFIGLAAFVGAGLMVAGITGFCGMALLLARAPWNQRTGTPSPTS